MTFSSSVCVCVCVPLNNIILKFNLNDVCFISLSKTASHNMKYHLPEQSIPPLTTDPTPPVIILRSPEVLILAGVLHPPPHIRHHLHQP